MIEKLDEKQLRELIVYITGRNGAAKEALLDYCRKEDAEVKTDNHALIIENAIKLHWKKAGAIIREFDMYGGGSESEEDFQREEQKILEMIEEKSFCLF